MDRNTTASELLPPLTSVDSEAAREPVEDPENHGCLYPPLARIRAHTQYEVDEELSPLTPPEQGSVEFELMIRHPILYPSSVPLDLPLTPTQVYLSKNQDVDGVGDNPLMSLFEIAASENLSPDEHTASAQSSFPATSMMADPRLEIVSFAKWTNVSIDNLEAATAVSRYLEIDHSVLGLFDADLFLEDLIGLFDADLFLEDLCRYERRFCSYLLVNSLLSWAFLGLSQTTALRRDLTSEFFLEAKRQMSSLSEIDSMPTLIALECLSLTAAFSGVGDQGRQYLRQAVKMGQRLGLFSKTAYNATDLCELRAACHCAWGLFSYATLHDFNRQQGELSSLEPTRFYSRHVIFFLVFGDQLPLQLARGSRSTHSVMILHIMAHSAIITLLRPLVLENHESQSGTASKPHIPAREVSSSSINQLRRCITIHKNRFAGRWPSVFWHTGCLFLGNHAIRSSEHEETRLQDLRLALTGYKSLCPRYPVTLVAMKKLLDLAAETQLVTVQDVNKFVQRLHRQIHNTSALNNSMKVWFMVNLDRALMVQGDTVDSE